ncbi:hypothetical protein GCM10028795_00080 [Lysobacter olei]
MTTRGSVAGWMSMLMVLGQLGVSGIKYLRESGDASAFLGYAPNLVAAATIPGLIVAVQLLRGAGSAAPYAWSQLWRETRTHALALLFSAGGLLAWEFVQVYRPNRTFDLQDVLATVAGAALWAAIVVVGRLSTEGAHRRADTILTAGTESTSP